MTTQTGLEPIPHPPGHMLVGNVFDIETAAPVQSLMRLARQYGPIFQLDLAGRRTLVVVSGISLVDEVCDDRRFCSQILKETLRLWPTAPGFTRYPYQPTVLDGKYQVDKGQGVMVLSAMLHRDPTVWGANAEEFDLSLHRTRAVIARMKRLFPHKRVP
jgi:cytochrome P450